jgi:hypothetical protein
MSARGGTLRSAPLVVAALVASSGLGCSKQREQQAPPPAASATAFPSATASAPLPPASATPVTLPAPVASGLPDAKGVSDAVNPRAEAAYSGPTGTVRGRVIVKGDSPPAEPQMLAKIPATCGSVARDAYGKLFREGPGRSLADVLVAVTGYKGYVPERESARRIVAKDCFYGTRTIALTYGQSIEIASGDKQPYIPELLGEKGQPQTVATPGGMSATVYPTRTGRYVLIDNLKLFMQSEVLVLKYATHAVTGLDGRFEIQGVPVGDVNVNALLPVAGINAGRRVKVEADKPTEELVFELTFDKASYEKSIAKPDAGAPAASASGSAPAAPKPPVPAPKSSP